MNGLTLYLFDKPQGTFVEKSESEKQQKIDDNPDNYICHICKFVITQKAEQISVDNSHTHTFINPAGISYHIACFQTANGCIQTGSFYSEHTWFAGYQWQLALCANCHEHMGWLFRGIDSFYGLILDRIIISGAE